MLEFLGEEKNICYGMTLINFSKLFIKKSDYLRLAIGFETNNKIRERIKMIKGFKKGSYKMSAKAALGCLVAAAVVFTNGVSVKALDTNNLAETNINQSSEVEQKTNPFIIDEETKAYEDISKIVKYAGFNFKLPDYIVDGNKPASYQLLKLSDTNNAVLIYFDGQGNDYSKNFSLTIFNGDVEKSLERVNEIKGRSRNDAEYKCDEEEKILGNVKGKIITLNAKIPEYKIDDKITVPESEEIMKYFVWEDNDVHYAIYYNRSTKTKQNSDKFSENEIEKIVESFKNIDEVTNVDYKRDIREDEELSTELGLMSIYDKDDLNKAAKILGFNPKMPLKVGDNVVVDGSGVGLTCDSDVENKKLYYELNLFYNYGKNRITFNESNHDSFNEYKDIIENGYVNKSDFLGEKTIQIKVDKIGVDGKDVYKYIYSYANPDEDAVSSDVCYEWQENGIYCSLVFFDIDIYQDDIAKEFVNSKAID